MDVDFPVVRRDTIAARLGAGQAVVAAALAEEFRVSEDAIRRDLRALAAEGRCRRVYGGALPIAPAAEPLAACLRSGMDRKRRLAVAGAATVKPGELVLLDSGSTNLAVVDALPEDADLTVVTNTVEIAAAVLRRGDLRLIVIGGQADPTVGGCVDGAALTALARMRVDRAFLGACSVSAEAGIGAVVFADATFKRAVVDAAAHVVVLATTEKLTERVPYRVAGLDEVDHLVLEAASMPEQRAGLAACCPLLIA